MNPTSPRATRREWLGLAVLALPCILATMDLTVLNLAVPHLSEDLKPTSSQLLWIMDIYGFLIAGSLITMGTLGDRIGRRKLLLMGAAAFGVASTMAAFSRTAETLIATRAVLGVAGATLAPSTLSLIRNMFLDDRQRTTAISIWVACFSFGAAIGPLLGGVMLEHFRWGSVFLLNVPIMILLMILGPLVLPEFKDPAAGRLDILSALLSVSAVLLIIYSLKRWAEYGFGAIPFLAAAAGCLIGAVFIRRQKILSHPLINLKLFRVPAFTTALAMNMLGCFVAFGAFWFIAQYLQLVMGLSPLKAGLWSTPSSLGFTIGTIATPSLRRKSSVGGVIAAGMVVTAIGFLMLIRVTPDGIVFLSTASFIYSLGLSPIFTLSADLIVGSAPPEQAGAAASISETGTEFGGAVGMAVLGSIGMAFYRAQVTGAFPDGVPAEAAEAARSTLGGAIAVAQTLPAEVGALVIEPAKEAFSQAMRRITGFCAVISILMAIPAVMILGKKHNEQK